MIYFESLRDYLLEQCDKADGDNDMANIRGILPRGLKNAPFMHDQTNRANVKSASPAISDVNRDCDVS